MSAVELVQANAVAAAVLAVLLANARSQLPYARTNGLLRVIMMLVLAVLAFDTLGSVVDGRMFAGSLVIVWVADIAYFLLLGAVAFCWFLYVHAVLNHDRFLPLGLWRIAAVLPFALYGAGVLASPLTAALLYVTPGNEYVRGPLFFVSHVVAIGYVAAASLLALAECRRKESPLGRRQLTSLVLFVVPTLCGGLAQSLNESLRLLLPGVVVSLVFVYLSLQHGQVVRDSLTGLYNRGRFDRYLASLCSRGKKESAWHLIIVDIDGFKTVNDRYGHPVGDDVLRGTADLLKKVFGRSRAFISRFGGDEFAVIVNGGGAHDVEALLRALDEAASELDIDALAREKGGAPATVLCEGERAAGAGCGRLSLSSGFSSSDDGETRDPVDMIAAADKSMYACKQRKAGKAEGTQGPEGRCLH